MMCEEHCMQVMNNVFFKSSYCQVDPEKALAQVNTDIAMLAVL